MALAVALLGGYLLLLGGTFATLLLDPDLILLTGSAVTVIGWLAIRRLHNRDAVPGVLVWLSAALLWALCSSLLGRYPRGSLEELFRLTWGFAMLAAGLVIGRGPERRRAALLGCLIAAAPVAWLAVREGLGLRLPMGGYLTEFGQPRAAATLNHPNNLAGFVALMVPLSLGGTAALLSRRSRWALLPGLLVGALLFAGAATYSKGGQLAILAGGTAWLLLLPSAALRAWFAADRRRLPLLVVCGLPLLAALLIGFWISPLGDRLRLFWELRGTLPRFERWGTWQAAASMVAAHPLVGVGPGTFGLAMPEFKTAASHAQLFTHAHNWYLHLGAEQGLVGLGLWLAALVSGLAATRRAMGVAEPESRWWLRGLLAGLAGFLVAGLLDYNVGVPAIGLAFWFLLGLGAAGDPRSMPGRQARGAALFGALLPAALLVPWLMFNRGQVAYLQACAAVGQDRLDQAAAALEVARSWDPHQRAYDLVRSDLAAWSGQQRLCAAILKPLATAERPPLDSHYLDRLAWIAYRDGNLAAARRWLERAIERDPAEPSLRVDLGLLLMAEDPARARQAFEQAAAQSPDAIGARAGLGAVLLGAGRPDEAARAFEEGARVGNPRDRPPRFLVAYGCVDAASQLPLAQAGSARLGRVRYHGAAAARLRLLAMELAALAQAASGGVEQDPGAPVPNP